MSVRIRIAGVALLSLCFACGGGGSNGPSLTITPATLTVTSGSTPAGFTATLTGSTAAIAWSLSGPGSISTTSGTSTSYTPPASLAASTTAILTATAGTLTASATITINVPAINLTVSPQTLTVAAGTAATTFTATLTGSSNAIAWSLSGLGSISTMAGTTTSYTPPISVTSTTTATLTATAGASLTASATITINVPAPITVTGTFVALNNLPVAGAGISIGAKNAITDANGSFTISNVTPPYDLVAVSGKVGVVYQGLTLTSPTIVLYNSLPTLPNTGTVMGSVSPTTLLTAANYTTSVAWGSPETTIFADSNSFSTNPFSLTLDWFGPASTTGNLHVLQWLNNSTTNLPTSYSGYQTKSGVVVAASGTTSNQDMTMGSVTSANLTGTLTVPTAYSPVFNVLTLTWGDGATMILAADSGPPGSTFNYVMPSGVGATVTILALATSTGVASGAFMSGLAPNATNVSMVVPAASTQGIPADAATGITTAQAFTWTPFAGGIDLVIFQPNLSTDPTYYVFTAATTTTIPDLSAQALGLPTGAHSYSWYVYGLAPFATLNAFASANYLTPFTEGLFSILIKPPPSIPNYSYSLTENGRTFKTQ